MRKLNAASLIVGLLILFFSVSLSIFLAFFLVQHPLLQLVLIICFYFVLMSLFFVIVKAIAPIQEGEVLENTRSTFTYDLFMGLGLFSFQFITETRLIPIPLRTFLLKLLGAKIGENTYPSGNITDPFLFEAGANCVIGLGSICTGHATVGGHSHLGRVILADQVTIGGNAVIYPDVKIGKGSIVAGGAVVLQGTVIGEGELWGGVPARLIKKINS